MWLDAGPEKVRSERLMEGRKLVSASLRVLADRGTCEFRLCFPGLCAHSHKRSPYAGAFSYTLCCRPYPILRIGSSHLVLMKLRGVAVVGGGSKISGLTHILPQLVNRKRNNQNIQTQRWFISSTEQIAPQSAHPVGVAVSLSHAPDASQGV